MSTLPTKTGPDWASIWADLLRSTGRTLLRLDGSDVAKGVLLGIDEFEEAQERRRQEAEQEAAERAEAEHAARKQRYSDPPSREPQYRENPEWYRDPPRYTDWPSNPRPAGATAPTRPHYYQPQPQTWGQSLPPRSVPRPLSPVNEWWLAPRLPFSPDGELNLPRRR